MRSLSNSEKHEQVQRVLLVTLGLNLLVAFGKIALGLLTGALSITADGFHSLTDGAGNVVGLVANHYAVRPPDEDHPYGHRRFETVAALFIGALLLFTTWELLQGVIRRIQGEIAPQITLLTPVVLLITLAINMLVSRYQIREGQRLQSQILLADAENTRADILVTASVIVGMLLVVMGWGWADAAVTLIVVLFIARAGWKVLRQTGDVLVDAAPYSSRELRSILGDVPPIGRVIRARSRGAMDDVHIDLDVEVPRELTTDHAANIRNSIRERFHDNLKGISEVDVHFVPARKAEPDYTLVARAHADALGLSTHEVRLREDESGRVLEMHVEVPPGRRLDAAHELVSQLESKVQSDLPDIKQVVSHIEPVQSKTKSDSSLADELDTVREKALALLQDQYPEIQWHDLRIYLYDNRFVMTIHATLLSQITVEAAHELAEAAELLLRNQIPDLSRVTIHTEPFDH